MKCTACTHEHKLHTYQSFYNKETGLILHQYFCNELNCFCHTETELPVNDSTTFKTTLRSLGMAVSTNK